MGIALAGCSKPRTQSTQGKHALRGKPKNARQLPTTDAEIYLGNLDGQISELTRLVAERPDIVNNVSRLSAAHHVRGRFRGDVDEIQLGIDGASTCIRLEPDNASCRMMRGEQEQSLHRFAEARADLERARVLGIDPTRAADLETELDWNDGLYDKAMAAIRKARATRPGTATWMREAQLDHDLDREAEADAAFESAEDMITDTAPLPVAHLNLQRGIQKAQRGLLDDACTFFREAVARMPTYVAGMEHLAEALHGLGKDDEATAIYEKVVKLSDDPEFAHALAELYDAKGKKAEARALEEKARTRYEELLKKYPEAMYWHASEFYMATGDTKRALALLQKNVTLRPNSTSYVALARAELANGLTSEAKTAIDKALAMPVRSASLFWTAANVARQSGDGASASTLGERAKALNPRIEALEPAIAPPARP
jgi:tetratricopeptide (TPR) repeat protein